MENTFSHIFIFSLYIAIIFSCLLETGFTKCLRYQVPICLNQKYILPYLHKITKKYLIITSQHKFLILSSFPKYRRMYTHHVRLFQHESSFFLIMRNLNHSRNIFFKLNSCHKYDIIGHKDGEAYEHRKKYRNTETDFNLPTNHTYVTSSWRYSIFWTKSTTEFNHHVENHL